MKKKLLILGAGGIASMVIEALKENNPYHEIGEFGQQACISHLMRQLMEKFIN